MSKQTTTAWLRYKLTENMVCKDPEKGISIIYFHDNEFLDLFRKAEQMEYAKMFELWDNGMKCDCEEGALSFDMYMARNYGVKV